MNGDLANNDHSNSVGWGFSFGAMVNGVVQLYNANKNREHSEKLQKLDQEFQEAEREKDRALQTKLQSDLRELQWKIVKENNRVLADEGNKNRLARLKETELNQKYAKHWCLKGLVISDLLEAYKDQKVTPLRIFPVFQGFSGAKLSKSSTQTLQRSYPMGGDRPCEVLDEVWNHEFEASLGVVRGLFVPLRSEPMLFLLVTQYGKEISFGVSYWGTNAPQPFSDYLLTEEASREILRYCADKLERMGTNPEELEDLALRECGRVMSKCIILMGAFFADAHYLIYESISPQFPKMLPQLVQGIEDIPVVRRLVWEMMSIYEVILDKLKGDRASLVPDLALDIAQALAAFNPNMAKAKLDYALKSWLQLRNVGVTSNSSLLELVGDNVAYGDQEFLQRLQQIYNRLHNQQASTKLKQIEGSLIRTLTGHSNYVSSVAFSPDGSTLASGSHDKAIKLWDVSSGKLKTTITGHYGSICSVAFSPDGLILATGAYKMIELWDISNGKIKTTLREHSHYINSVAFSPDGSTLASSSCDKAIKLWDIINGSCKITITEHLSNIYSVAFSPDGSTLASGNMNCQIQLWDIINGSCKITITEHLSNVYSVAFSPDAQTLASGSFDGKIQLWDVMNGKIKTTLWSHFGSVHSVAFSPDGLILAAGASKMIELWDVSCGKLKTTLAGHFSSVESVAFSPDGRTLASGSKDKTIKLWGIPVDF